MKARLEVREDTDHAEGALALPTDNAPSAEAARAAKRRGRISQFQFRELLEAETSRP